MGLVISRILHANEVKEMFMISYMSQRGATPYTMELLPGGDLRSTDDSAVIRHKFKVALRRQRRLERALIEIEKGHGQIAKCMSPCLVREFNEGEQAVVKDETGNVTEFKWRDEARSIMPNRSSRQGLGALEKLVVHSGKTGSIQLEDVAVSSEEIVAFDVVKNEKQKAEPLRGSLKEKRSRSRPEPRSRKATTTKGQRQSMSVTQMMKEPEPHLLPPLVETPSYLVVERMQLGSTKKTKKAWPPKDVVRNALKDPKTRPTTYFIARFRPTPNSDYVEVEYRFNKSTGKDAFQCISGSLDMLLTGEALAQYQKDKENNNVNEKIAFFKIIPHIFSNYEGRIWWNGYIVKIDGGIDTRMRLKSLSMDPPAFVFDLSGLRYISATRNDTRLTFVGHNQEGGEGEAVETGNAFIKRTFVIRGRTEHELKQLDIRHAKETTFVSVVLPTLSGIPVSLKNSSAKVTVSGNKSVFNMAEQLEPQETEGSKSENSQIETV